MLAKKLKEKYKGKTLNDLKKIIAKKEGKKDWREIKVEKFPVRKLKLYLWK